jgi:hypothetical protein
VDRRLNPRRRRRALAVLAVAVGLVHGWLIEAVRDRLDEGAAAAAMPARLQVAYVRTLEPEPPPAVVPRPAPPPAPRAAPVPRPAASAARAVRPERVPAAPPPPAPSPVVAEAVPVPAEAAASAFPALAPPAEAVAAAPPAASAVAAAPAASSPADGFAWPASTRLSYTLTGQVRGEVHGTAQVEWVREGGRYQVHLDVTVGAPFAPLVTRRMSSDGTLGPAGLTPGRYDEDTKAMFRDRRRLTIHLDEAFVRLPNGERRPRPDGVQDSASQFVQLAWRFARDPSLLATGRTVEVPLALPRRVSLWTYEVLGEEEVHTGFGPLATVHLKPRAGSRRGGDLEAELWVAPSLRYLPVRIRIRQDDENWLDLLLARKPELAGS